VTWTVGPRAVIDAVTSAGSFLDGGGSKPLQRAAIALLEPAHVEAETAALQRVFSDKRELLVRGTRRLGMTIDREPDGTFYVWANLSGLPPALADGMALFRAALEHKVIVVPGEFFDVNPGKRRGGRPSRFRQYARLSFGPSRDALERALGRLERVIDEAAARD
jgi:aspartate/methionine/tyrosine aminotransferase